MSFVIEYHIQIYGANGKAEVRSWVAPASMQAATEGEWKVMGGLRHALEGKEIEFA